jgi:hypothetical protein
MNTERQQDEAGDASRKPNTITLSVAEVFGPT